MLQNQCKHFGVSATRQRRVQRSYCKHCTPPSHRTKHWWTLYNNVKKEQKKDYITVLIDVRLHILKVFQVVRLCPGQTDHRWYVLVQFSFCFVCQFIVKTSAAIHSAPQAVCTSHVSCTLHVAYRHVGAQTCKLSGYKAIMGSMSPLAFKVRRSMRQSKQLLGLWFRFHAEPTLFAHTTCLKCHTEHSHRPKRLRLRSAGSGLVAVPESTFRSRGDDANAAVAPRFLCSLCCWRCPRASIFVMLRHIYTSARAVIALHYTDMLCQHFGDGFISVSILI